MPEPRVLVVTSGLRLGGAEVFLDALVRRLRGGPERVAVLSLTDRTPLSSGLAASGFRVECLGLPRPGALPRARGAAWRLARMHEPDVVLGWMYHGCLVGSWCSARLGRPAVWSIHGSLDDWSLHSGRTRMVIRAARHYSRSPAAICYASTRARRQHEGSGFHAEGGVVIPTGVEPERFRRLPGARERQRQVIGATEETLVIGHVSRFHPVKDQWTLVAGAGEAARRGVPLHLVVAGAGLDRSNAALMGWLYEAGLAQRSTLLGITDDVARWLAAFDLFVLPSRAESSPIALLEAMAAEVPCIVTDVGDCCEMLGDAGVVIPVAHPSALADAITGLWQAGPAVREARGRAGRARAGERYSIQRAVVAYEGLLGAIGGGG